MDPDDFAQVARIAEALEDIRREQPTRRDLFAAAALQGLLAGGSAEELRGMPDVGKWLADTTTAAVGIADAMLTATARPKQQ